MPTNLFNWLNCSSKTIRLIIILLVFPLFFHGQTLTGLWTGSLSNDSNTVRKDQSFEIALTEYKGNVYGYSRSEFIVNDVLYYVMKRVKGTIDGDVCEVVDDEIISFNFPTKLDKGVKVTSSFRRNKNDGIWQLEGTWKTNATKKYYTVTGKVGLEQEKDLTASKIFPHLEELKLANDIAFYKEREEGIPIVKIAKPEKLKTNLPKIDEQLTQHTGTMAVANKPVTINIETITNEEVLPSIKMIGEELPKTTTKNISTDIAAAKPLVSDNKVAINAALRKADENRIAKEENEKRLNEIALAKKEVQAAAEKSIVKQTTTKASENPKPITTVANPVPIVSKTEKPVAIAKPPTPEKQEVKPVTPTAPIIAEVRKTREEITSSAAVVLGRKSEFAQEVNYKSDSLILSLYDNGEIDGDTVSVFLNGEVIMAKQGLKASAIKKTIYISPDSEDFTLVLFADNLGKYPPNTGLLVVRDGEDIYNLRFSSDFQKSSGIVFRRKK